MDILALTVWSGFGLIFLILILWVWINRHKKDGEKYKIERFPLRDAALMGAILGALDLLLIGTVEEITPVGVLRRHALVLGALVVWIIYHRFQRFRDKNKRVGLGYPILLFFLERPVRLMAITMLVVLACAIAYAYFGFYETDHSDPATPYQMISISGSGNYEAFASALYLSFVTVTTLGFGDLHPVGFSRIVAVVEALFGFFVISMIIAMVSSRVTDGNLFGEIRKRLEKVRQ